MNKLAIILLFLASSVFCQPFAGTNFVSREIRCDEPALWVHDRLHLNERFVGQQKLWDIFSVAKAGKTNLADLLPALLKGDDLQLERYQVTFNDGYLDLQILSKLRFDPGQPSKFRLLSTFVGISTKSGSFVLGEPGVEMLVFAENGGKILWFPDAGTPDDLAADVRDTVGIESVVSRDLELKCTLNVHQNQQVLLHWDLTRVTSNAPSAAFLTKLHRLHPMSRNDYQRLFTRLQIAKPGYYAIDVGGFTNRVADPNLSSNLLHGKEGRIPLTKYKIDGSFGDWRQYKTAWLEEFEKKSVIVRNGGPMDDTGSVNITECCYSNDDHYLYLFLKFTPTIEQRYGGKHPAGFIAHLYVSDDSESNQNADYALGKAGTEIYVPFGPYSNSKAGKSDSNSLVSYTIRRRDTSTQEFSIKVRDESSRMPVPLINHGKDGVELALLLSDLGKTIGDKFYLMCQDNGFPFSHDHSILIAIEE